MMKAILRYIWVFIMIFSSGLSCNFARAESVNLPDPLVDETLIQPAPNAHKQQSVIVLAGGCFWGVQAVFQHVKGVVEATSGYSGGEAATAHYEIVGQGTSGHAEAVKVVYDPSQITLGKILKVFFSVAHNPTQLNFQGPDHGTQYRSAIFFQTDEQRRIVSAYIDQLQKAALFSAPIVTSLEPFKAFYPAEDYHQNYARLHPDNPYIVRHDAPKVKALEETLPQLWVKPI